MNLHRDVRLSQWGMRGVEQSPVFQRDHGGTKAAASIAVGSIGEQHGISSLRKNRTCIDRGTSPSLPGKCLEALEIDDALELPKHGGLADTEREKVICG